MDKEQIIAIMEEHLFVSDEWGGSKLAEWKWGNNTVIDGLDDTADAIIEYLQPPAEKCPKCGESGPVLHCEQCGHDWNRLRLTD